MAEPTLYWHDYETFGIDPRADRPAQFAGVRTDCELNIVDDPLIIYCQPPADYLPHPESCVLTGITPQIAESKGVPEVEFIRRIHEQIAKPDTCVLGYNSIRFDDEFTRNILYRNFYDPYAREWQQGNSRWDLIDVVRAAHALRPDGVSWPMDDEGRPVFKLEELTKANAIQHLDAHDALADVHATIALAKAIKNAQPKLFQFLWRHRVKSEVNKLLQLGSFMPVVYVSGRYSSQKNCLAVVLPLCRHPINNNGVIVYDLSAAPDPLLSLTAEEIKQRVFTAVADLPEGQERVPLKTVHSNKCPVLAPIHVLRESDQQRLGIDLPLCYRHLDQIRHARNLADKIAQVFMAPDFLEDPENDPDFMLYSGGFFPDSDRQKMFNIRAMSAAQLADYSADFNDPRLKEMLFRYRARNYPQSLTPDESGNWREFCIDKLSGTQGAGQSLTFSAYQAELDRLSTQANVDTEILGELADYARLTKERLGL